MKRVLVYLGNLSPAFLTVLDVFSSPQDLDLIFIETGKAKSKLPANLADKHYLLKDSVNQLEGLFEEIEREYAKIYCLSVSYQNALKFRRLNNKDNKLTFMVPSQKCIETLINKQLMTAAASKVDLPVLESTYLPSQQNDISFPAVIRPVSEEQADFKAALIESERELSTYLNNPIVSQPFISGPNLVAHVAKKDDQVSIEYFLVENKFEGVSLTMKKVEEAKYAYLNEKVADFLAEINFEGVGHFEFIVSDKNYLDLYFLDFNGRLGGTTLKSYALGYNEIQKVFALNGIAINVAQKKKHFKVVTNYMSLLKLFIRTLKAKSDPLDFPCTKSLTTLKRCTGLVFKANNELSSVSWRIKLYFLWNTLLEKL